MKTLRFIIAVIMAFGMSAAAISQNRVFNFKGFLFLFGQLPIFVIVCFRFGNDLSCRRDCRVFGSEVFAYRRDCRFTTGTLNGW